MPERVFLPVLEPRDSVRRRNRQDPSNSIWSLVRSAYLIHAECGTYLKGKQIQQFSAEGRIHPVAPSRLCSKSLIFQRLPIAVAATVNKMGSKGATTAILP